MSRFLATVLCVCCALSELSARNPLPIDPQITNDSLSNDPLPTDEPLLLEVDASEASRLLIHNVLTIPVQSGPLTLYYPKWIPGTHSTTGPINSLVDLQIKANGKIIPWKRDEVDGYTLHTTVPEGVKQLRLVYDSIMNSNDRFAATPKLMPFNWNMVLLYPKGKSIQQQKCVASLKLPKKWKLGTALPIDSSKDQITLFKAVTLETLVDSPVLCGEYFREVSLDRPIAMGRRGFRSHSLILACDSEEGLQLTPKFEESCKRLITEANLLFGAEHYDYYRFLLALSDRLRPSGLEHHQSSDNHLKERALLEPYAPILGGHLLAHEFMHSWCGKYRRPLEMVQADFQKPQLTKLLWVYEGLTDYLAFLLSSRSGFFAEDQARDYLAMISERLSNQRGRTWRPLEDVTSGADTLSRSGSEWNSRRRTVGDYYAEGVLIWLEVDMMIRQHTQGKKSLDDFCKLFFGNNSGPAEVKTYTFEDLVSTLNSVDPFNWSDHLKRRVAQVTDGPPLEGIHLAGWKLSFQEKPSELNKIYSGMMKSTDLTSSIGMMLRSDGTVSDVIPGKSADQAGVGPGMKLIAVNGRKWNNERLKDALQTSKKTGKIDLLFENNEFFKSYQLKYNEGIKYPVLEKYSLAQENLFPQLLKPKGDYSKPLPELKK